MIFLWILLALVLLIVLILFLRIRLIIDYHGRLKTVIRVMWFRFDIQEIIGRKRSKAKEKKGAPKAKTKEKAFLQKPKISGPSDVLGFAEFLIHLAGVIKDTLTDFFSKAKVNLKELHVKVGSDDAAETALRTGAVQQSANFLCAALQNFSKFRCNSKNLSIAPDFVSSESSFSFHLVISCSLVHFLGVYLRANMRFLD